MGKGKRKLPMELIGKKENRMVSFSKRRKGLIKKAEEFHSITGSSIAVIVISEAGRPSVYGAPSFDSVLHRFQLQHNSDGILSTHSHSHTATPETLFIGDQGGSNQEDENVVVVADQEPCPETLDLPHHHSFDTSSEFLIPQGSTTAPSVPMAASPEDDECLFDIDTLLLLLDGKGEDNAAVNGTHPDHPTPDDENVVVMADQEPWPAALDLPHHYSFHASSPPPDQVVDRGSKENDAFPVFN